MTPQRPSDEGEFHKVTQRHLWCCDHLGYQKHALSCEAAQAHRGKEKRNSLRGGEVQQKESDECGFQILALPLMS